MPRSVQWAAGRVGSIPLLLGAAFVRPAGLGGTDQHSVPLTLSHPPLQGYRVPVCQERLSQLLADALIRRVVSQVLELAQDRFAKSYSSTGSSRL